MRRTRPCRCRTRRPRGRRGREHGLAEGGGDKTHAAAEATLAEAGAASRTGGTGGVEYVGRAHSARDPVVQHLDGVAALRVEFARDLADLSREARRFEVVEDDEVPLARVPARAQASKGRVVRRKIGQRFLVTHGDGLRRDR